MINVTQPLDMEHPGTKDFLTNLQGNILKSHGRELALHIIVRFRANYVKTARVWLAHFAEHVVTSAWNQHEQAMQKNNKQQLFAMVLLTADGYRFLGFNDTQIPSDGTDNFGFGMKNRSNFLQDPEPNTWDKPYNDVVHAMILLAHNKIGDLQKVSKSISLQLGRFCEPIHFEEGQRLRNNGQVIEYFGYVDGISQPLFIKQDIEDELTKRGSTNWNPQANLDLVLVEEGTGRQTYGSFMVFRKLEQDVEKFGKLGNELADQLELKGPDREKAGAYMMGRFNSGEPLIKTSVNQTDTFPNDFIFDMDAQGLVCPFHAHIRKMNPRSRTGEDDVRIVRRGITYGPPQLTALRTYPWELAPAPPVGMLFMSFQAKLKNFETLQARANDENFSQTGTGVDPIIGRVGPNLVPQSWPSKNNVRFAINDVVTFRGGEYFFAPSIQTLSNLESLGKAHLKLRDDQKERFKTAARRLMDNPSELASVGLLWKDNRRMEAVAVVGIGQEDFDDFYAYLVPFLPLLDTHIDMSINLPGNPEVESLTDAQKNHFYEAITKLLDPVVLETFATKWAASREEGLQFIGMEIQEVGLLYAYLNNFEIKLNLFLWL